jgi:hypothetical protein
MVVLRADWAEGRTVASARETCKADADHVGGLQPSGPVRLGLHPIDRTIEAPGLADTGERSSLATVG